MIAFRVAVSAVLFGALAGVTVARAQTDRVTQTVPVWGATVLEVDVDNGGAQFETGPASAQAPLVSFGATMRGGTDAQLPLQWTRVGKRIVVTVGRGKGASMLPFVAHQQLTYSVTYPSNLKLVVHAFDGEVHVDRPISPVEVTDAQGDVLITDPRAPVSVDNGNGNVVVHRAVAAIDLASDVGNVTADLAADWLARPVRMESANGTVRLTVPAGFSAKVDASSDNGTVHNALDSAATAAKAPPVWLYTERGDVWLSLATAAGQ